MSNVSLDLFSELNDKSIEYCHFKSNEHLKAGVDGDTDLDILVSVKCYNEFLNIASKHGFKRFEPDGIGSYPGVSNLFALNEENGKIIHIHLHTQLITGKGLVKDYVLPWADIVLRESILHEMGIKVTEPSMELILLFTRLAVKRKPSERAKSSKGFFYVAEDDQREIDYLRNRSDNKKLKTFFESMFGIPISKRLLSMYYSQPIKESEFFHYEKFVRERMKDYRRLSGVDASVLSFKNKAIRKCNIYSNKYLESLVKIKKRPYGRPGIMVAFVGIDGSGKSAMLAEIKSWLAEEFDVMEFYLGAGDGKKSVFVQAPIAIYQAVQRKKAPNNQMVDKGNNKDGYTSKSTIKAIGAALTYSKLAKDNVDKVIKAKKYAENGGIALFDRFPQSEIEVLHDGLRVRKYVKGSNNAIVKKCADAELHAFRHIESIGVDLVLRMVVDPRVAYARKSEDEPNCSIREEKANTLIKLKYGDAKRIVNIDANASYEEVLANIKREVWNIL